MTEINFIKGKGLITKNIEDLTVGGYFEIPVSLYEKIHKYINKPMNLVVEMGGVVNTFTCNVDTDTTGYLNFIEDHGVLKLSIIVPDIVLAGVILKGTLKLKLD